MLVFLMTSSETASAQVQSTVVQGLSVEAVSRGAGPPLLFLHPHLGLWKAEPFIDALAKHFSVLAPSHPGFGNSNVNPSMTSVEDLAYFYLDLLDQWNLRSVTVVGSSLGGWIALALAIKDCHRIDKLVLLDSTGVHFGGADQEDIADVFSMSEQDFASRAFSDARLGKKDFASMTDAELLVSARNREAAARYAWMPPLYDPKLGQRLHRVRSPTLVLWGAQDRITAIDYGERLSAALPNAKFERIAQAGHFPHIERPDEVARRITAFGIT